MSNLDSPNDRGSPRHSFVNASPFGRATRATNDIPATSKQSVGQRGFPWSSPVQKLPKFTLWSSTKASKTKEVPLTLTERLHGYVYGEALTLAPFPTGLPPEFHTWGHLVS